MSAACVALAAEATEMQNRSIVVRLENWALCLRLYVPGWTAPSPIGSSLSSAESRWCSGFRSVHVDVTRDLDVHDAKAIESAVSILSLYHHTILKAWYVRKLSPGSCLGYAARVSHRKRKPFRLFDGELEAAHALLVEALALPAAVRKVRAQALALEVLVMA